MLPTIPYAAMFYLTQIQMILKMDRLPVELPTPANPSANDAAAVQELLGGKFGEMSTLMNYTFQSCNFRGRTRLRT
jgi:Mn-containing catalase